MSDVTEVRPADESSPRPNRAVGVSIACVFVLGTVAALLWRAQKAAPAIEAKPAPVAFEPATVAPSNVEPTEEPTAEEPEVVPHASEVPLDEKLVSSADAVSSDDAVSSEVIEATGDAVLAAGETSVPAVVTPPDPYLEALMLDPLSVRDRRRLPRRS